MAYWENYDHHQLGIAYIVLGVMGMANYSEQPKGWEKMPLRSGWKTAFGMSTYIDAKQR